MRKRRKLIESEEEDLCKRNKLLKERKASIESKIRKMKELLKSSNIRQDQSQGKCCVGSCA